MACKRCEISIYIKDNGIDFSVIEICHGVHSEEAKIVEIAPSGFEVKSFLSE